MTFIKAICSNISHLIHKVDYLVRLAMLARAWHNEAVSPLTLKIHYLLDPLARSSLCDRYTLSDLSRLLAEGRMFNAAIKPFKVIQHGY